MSYAFRQTRKRRAKRNLKKPTMHHSVKSKASFGGNPAMVISGRAKAEGLDYWGYVKANYPGWCTRVEMAYVVAERDRIKAERTKVKRRQVK